MRTPSDPEAEDSRSITEPARRRGTPSPSRTQGLVARVLGIALGAVLAVHVLPGLRIPDGPPSLPLAVSVSVVRSGEVGLADGGQLLAEADVRPGEAGAARGRLPLASETSVPIELSVQDVGSPSGLEDQLWLRVTLGDALVFEGTQARLRRSSSRSLTISPGVTVPIDVTVGLLPGADARAAGRRTELRLQIVSPAAGAAVAGST